MSWAAARSALQNESTVFVIGANAGVTNCGAVDDLVSLSKLVSEHEIW